MSKVKYNVKSGGASAQVSGAALDMFTQLLDKVAPNLKREMEEFALDLEKHARKNWLVREKDSQRSIDKFYTVFYVTPDLTITTGVGNSAPYAFAIKVGKESNSNFAVGKNLAVEAVFKPAEKRIEELVDRIGDEILRVAGRRF